MFGCSCLAVCGTYDTHFQVILLDSCCNLLNVDQLLFVDKFRGITLEEEQDWSVKLRNVLIVIPGNALRIPIGKSFLK